MTHGFVIFAGLLLPIPGVAIESDLRNGHYQHSVPTVADAGVVIQTWAARRSDQGWGRVFISANSSEGVVTSVIVWYSDLTPATVAQKLSKERVCVQGASSELSCKVGGAAFTARTCGGGMMLWTDKQIGDRFDEWCELVKKGAPDIKR
jgi:hypothetical protein